MENRIKIGDLISLKRSLISHYKGDGMPIYLVMDIRERKNSTGVLLDVQKIGESRMRKGLSSKIYEVHR